MKKIRWRRCRIQDEGDRMKTGFPDCGPAVPFSPMQSWVEVRTVLALLATEHRMRLMEWVTVLEALVATADVTYPWTVSRVTPYIML